MLTSIVLLAASLGQFEDLAMLDKKIELYASAEPIDRRLKLARCPADPVITPLADNSVIVRCPSIGWRLRVNSSADADLVKSVQVVIRKGDMIECVISGPGFAVSTQGVALNDAGIGEIVRVKSSSSSASVSAVAVAAGIAKI